MVAHTWIKFHHVFHFLCLLTAFGLASRCLLKFLEDGSISSIQYKKFHHTSPDHIYPSFSWCIINPFLENELNKYGDGINVTSYSYFLKGLYWDDRMVDIDFDNVTVSLSDNLYWINSYLHDYTKYFYNHALKEYDSLGWNPIFYISFRSSHRKCFTFDIPLVEDKLVWIFDVKVDNKFFKDNVRPDRYQYDAGFYAYFHYPGQRFTSGYTIKYDWEAKSNQSNPYMMSFDVKDIEVTINRNRPQDPCIEDWRNYGKVLMDDIMLKAGCKPPHWKTSHKIPMCSKPEQMVYFEDQPSTTKVESFGPPCNVIQSLQYTYEENELVTEGKLLPVI